MFPGNENIILDLTRQLAPIDSNLDLPALEEKRKSISKQIQDLETEYESKETKIEEYKGLLTEVSQSISEKSKFTIDGGEVDIEIAHTDFVKQSKDLVEAEKVYQKAKQQLEVAEEKIKHLDNHQYDPNCKFCCDNEFVKDAMNAKNTLPELQAIVKQALIDSTGIQQTLDRWDGVEEQYNEWIDLTGKHSQAKGILRTAEAELKTLESREELLETQLDKVEEDIEKYFENEETIDGNKELEKQIKELEVEKKKLESDIKDITKQIATTNGYISSLQTYIEGVKQKMNDVKDLEEKNRLYTYYLDAVKRDGIPYELISKALPVIESEINNILGQVVDFGITLEMDGKSINAKIVYEDQEIYLLNKIKEDKQ